MNELNCERDACMASGFATVEAVQADDFVRMNDVLRRTHEALELPRHDEVNERLFPWVASVYPGTPLYATRLWEYPWAVRHARLSPGMTCADVGCGMTAFTPYLVSEQGCEVTGLDSDIVGGGFPKGAFGVDPDWLRRSNVAFRRCGMAALAADDSSFDRVFCISVIEHVPSDIVLRGIREMARILKPGGLAVLTMDLCISETLSPVNPLTLIWESGLVPAGTLNLTWPTRRFGHYYKRGHAADVFGMVLRKDDDIVDERYVDASDAAARSLERWKIPMCRGRAPRDAVPLPFWKRLKLARTLVAGGYDAMMADIPGDDAERSS